MLSSRGLAWPGRVKRIHNMSFPPSPSIRSARNIRNFGSALRRSTGTSPDAGGRPLSGRRRPVVGVSHSSRWSTAPTVASAAAFSLYPWKWSSKKDGTAASEPAAAASATDPLATTTATTLPPPPPLPPTAAATETQLASQLQPQLPSLPGVDEAAVAEILDGAALLDLPDQLGYLHALGLDFGWGPTAMCQWLLEHVHIWLGLPWWAAIGTTALLFRAAIFLPSLTAADESHKFQELRKDPKFAATMAEMQQTMARGGRLARAKAMELRMTTKRMQQQAGISVWKTFIPLVNVPFGFGMFRLLRSMGTLPVPGMENAGLLWFTDLTVPDPYFVLPLASAGIMYLIFRSNIVYMAPEQAQIMKIVQIVISPLSIIVTVKMNAGLTLFFCVSSILQLIQTWLSRQPWLRQWRGMPPLQKVGQTAASRQAVMHLSPDSTWQAPRAISTTATAATISSAGGVSASSVAGAAGAASPAGPPSTVDLLKKGWDKMMGSAQKKKGETKTSQVMAKAEEYEKKRALEEEENLYRRREAERQLRELKRRMAKEGGK